MVAKNTEFYELSIKAGGVFTPNTPIDIKDLFSGRQHQLRKVIDVIFQKGQHAIIFGERGVGKTSLANVLSQFITQTNDLLSVRINCDSQDTFDSIWRKLFDEMALRINKPGIGFNAHEQQQIYSSDYFFGSKEVTPNLLRRTLLGLSQNFLLFLIIDEFDRLGSDVKSLFADLIKSLSDHSLSTTIALIGVGESIDELISDHASVSRALVQIHMPRMNPTEIRTILENGISKLEMKMSPETIDQILIIAKGLPHYAHLLGLHCVREALDNASKIVSNVHLEEAIKKSIEDSQHSIKSAYQKAIRSAHKNTLFADVLLACALVDTDKYEGFAAQDIRKPLSDIAEKAYEIPAYSKHLNEFSQEKRGNILIKAGTRRLFRYKFRNPLMQTFIVMQGILSNKIKAESLKLISRRYNPTLFDD